MDEKKEMLSLTPEKIGQKPQLIKVFRFDSSKRSDLGK
jgi:hypothetical protein